MRHQGVRARSVQRSFVRVENTTQRKQKTTRITNNNKTKEEKKRHTLNIRTSPFVVHESLAFHSDGHLCLDGVVTHALFRSLAPHKLSLTNTTGPSVVELLFFLAH